MSKFVYDFGEKESKVITKEETIAFARKAKTGDQEALNKIIQANLRFVVTIANRYKYKSLRDTISDGIMGLIIAAQKFDPNRNVKFLTYARWWIMQSILLHIRDDRLISVPIQSYRKTKIAKTANTDTNYKYESVISSAVRAGKICSMDQPYSNTTDFCLADSIKSNENVQDKAIQNEINLKRKKVIAESLEVLSERDRDIVIHRFGLYNQPVLIWRELGKTWGLSKQGVALIEGRYLKMMRNVTMQKEWVITKVKKADKIVNREKNKAVRIVRNSDIIKHRLGLQGSEIIPLNSLARKWGISKQRVCQIVKSYTLQTKDQIAC